MEGDFCKAKHCFPNPSQIVRGEGRSVLGKRSRSCRLLEELGVSDSFASLQTQRDMSKENAAREVARAQTLASTMHHIDRIWARFS